VERIRPAGRDVAEGTGAGTDLAHNHERGVLLVPAFADIRATRFLADGDEIVLLHDRPRLGIALGNGSLDPDPFGLAQYLGIRPMRLFRMPDALHLVCRGSIE